MLLFIAFHDSLSGVSVRQDKQIGVTMAFVLHKAKVIALLDVGHSNGLWMYPGYIQNNTKKASIIRYQKKTETSSIVAT